MRKWQSLFSKNERQPHDFDDLVEEFAAALSNEFGVELNMNASKDVEWCDYINDVSMVLDTYVRDWVLNLIGHTHPELGIGVTDAVLDETRERLAEEIHSLKGDGPMLPDITPEDVMREGKENCYQPVPILINDDETADDVAARVSRVLQHVESHITLQASTRGID